VNGAGGQASLVGDTRLGEDGVRQLRTYLDLIARWRGSLDLVGRVRDEELEGVHVPGALAALPLLPATGRLLDIGSGVGLPAVVLLLARDGLEGVLLEPRERRWAFLREVVRELGLKAEVRREELSCHAGGGYAAVTVRGVRPQVWWGALPRLVGEGGVAVWWTSAEKAEEWRGKAGSGRVVLSALPPHCRGSLLTWRRCST
jgi:16S rRNA (guanine527-N7)-methyltransferase